jgi:hypothetical protein
MLQLSKQISTKALGQKESHVSLPARGLLRDIGQLPDTCRSLGIQATQSEKSGNYVRNFVGFEPILHHQYRPAKQAFLLQHNLVIPDIHQG